MVFTLGLEMFEGYGDILVPALFQKEAVSQCSDVVSAVPIADHHVKSLHIRRVVLVTYTISNINFNLKNDLYSV